MARGALQNILAPEDAHETFKKYHHKKGDIGYVVDGYVSNRYRPERFEPQETASSAYLSLNGHEVLIKHFCIYVL